MQIQEPYPFNCVKSYRSTILTISFSQPRNPQTPVNPHRLAGTALDQTPAATVAPPKKPQAKSSKQTKHQPIAPASDRDPSESDPELPPITPIIPAAPPARRRGRPSKSQKPPPPPIESNEPDTTILNPKFTKSGRTIRATSKVTEANSITSEFKHIKDHKANTQTNKATRQQARAAAQLLSAKSQVQTPYTLKSFVNHWLSKYPQTHPTPPLQEQRAIHIDTDGDDAPVSDNDNPFGDHKDTA